jgi:hypothetical protein
MGSLRLRVAVTRSLRRMAAERRLTLSESIRRALPATLNDVPSGVALAPLHRQHYRSHERGSGE